MMYVVVKIIAKISIAATNSMRLGPAGLTGTAAPSRTVNAGVRSCTFALAASS